MKNMKLKKKPQLMILTVNCTILLFIRKSIEIKTELFLEFFIIK